MNTANPTQEEQSAPPTGLLIVDKPAGFTSFQVVSRCRRLYGTRKVGHAGTLDPMATGVLIIGIGRATRLLGYLALHDKNYLATIRLGQATTTDDAEGELVATVDTANTSDMAIAAGMVALTGNIQQVPSSVSAIKINGQRAYARVRNGEKVELAARPVTVSKFELLALRRHDGVIDLDVSVDCSSGTYVRALARDLGAGLGVGGHLTALRRTRIGRYSIFDSVRLPENSEKVNEPPGLMSMAQAARLSLPTVNITEEQKIDAGHGKILDIGLVEPVTALIGPDDGLVALYRPDSERDSIAKAIAVFI